MNEEALVSKVEREVCLEEALSDIPSAREFKCFNCKSAYYMIEKDGELWVIA
jgi:hypothetical protein